MKFNFGNIVVVDGDSIGVIVKSWSDQTHEVYIRVNNGIKTYHESTIQHFIFSKYLSEEERSFYK